MRRGDHASIPGSQLAMAEADREAAWQEIHRELSRYEGPNGYEAPRWGINTRASSDVSGEFHERYTLAGPKQRQRPREWEDGMATEGERAAFGWQIGVWDRIAGVYICEIDRRFARWSSRSSVAPP
jgi:hypothetical protein